MHWHDPLVRLRDQFLALLVELVQLGSLLFRLQLPVQSLQLLLLNDPLCTGLDRLVCHFELVLAHARFRRLGCGWPCLRGTSLSLLPPLLCLLRLLELLGPFNCPPVACLDRLRIVFELLCFVVLLVLYQRLLVSQFVHLLCVAAELPLYLMLFLRTRLSTRSITSSLIQNRSNKISERTAGPTPCSLQSLSTARPFAPAHFPSGC